MSTSETPTVKLNLRNQSYERIPETVAIEAPVGIFINDEHLTTILATPEKLKELAVGFLVDEGIVKSLKDITEIHTKELEVRVHTAHSLDARIKTYGVVKLIKTSCGSIGDYFRLLDRLEKPYVHSKLTVTPEAILKTVQTLNTNSKVFRATGGTHSASVCSREGEVYAFAEDIGRHNAVDKVLGEALMRGVDLTNSILASSGRQSIDMVTKAARVGAPIVASIAGPLYSAIQVAEKTGVTLICFVRGQRMNIYTHPERVLYPKPADE